MLQHDITHGMNHLRNNDAEGKDLGVAFAHALNQALLNYAETSTEKKIINIVRFFTFHEALQSLNPSRHEMFQPVMDRYNTRRIDGNKSPEVGFHEWAEDLLLDASDTVKSFSTLFVGYAEDKELITFPENATMPEKAALFTSVIQKKIEELNEHVIPFIDDGSMADPMSQYYRVSRRQ